MATKKPKIQGYINKDIFEHLEAESIAWGLSQSQALERILSERYNRAIASNNSLPIDDRLTDLEKRIKELACRLEKLEGLPTESLGNPPTDTVSAVDEIAEELPRLKAIKDAENQRIALDLPSDTLPYAIALLDQRNRIIGFWRGGKDGFVESLDAARHYRGETSAKKQVAKLSKTCVLTEGTRLSYKSVAELSNLCKPKAS